MTDLKILYKIYRHLSKDSKLLSYYVKKYDRETNTGVTVRTKKIEITYEVSGQQLSSSFNAYDGGMFRKLNFKSKEYFPFMEWVKDLENRGLLDSYSKP